MGDIHIIANSSGKAPIVSAVLEKIEDGHGEGTKFMHKNGLKNTLGVVDHPEEEGNLLVDVHRGVSLRSIHRKKTQSKKNVNEPGTSVLKQVHRTESNLWPKILEVNFDYFLTITNVFRKLLKVIKNDRILSTSDGKPLTTRLNLALNVSLNLFLKSQNILIKITSHRAKLGTTRR